MTHWFISNFPWKSLVGYVMIQLSAYLLFGVDGFIVFLGIPFLMVYIMIVFMCLHGKFSGIIEEILVPEFIEKRPFKEISLRRKETLDEIMMNVNSKVNCMMGIEFGYTSSDTMVRDYKAIMKRFEIKYHDVYKETPIEEIQGWDKILLIAKNIENEDLDSVYQNLVPLELMNTYGKNKTNEYELSSINNSKDVSNAV